jgi:hypothetical protein
MTAINSDQKILIRSNLTGYILTLSITAHKCEDVDYTYTVTISGRQRDYRRALVAAVAMAVNV